MTGVIDTVVKPIIETPEQETFVVNFESCLKAFHITVVDVVQMVDNFYLNVGNWSFSPQEAIRFQLVNGHCFQFLDKE